MLSKTAEISQDSPCSKKGVHYGTSEEYETSSDIEIITEPFIQSVMMDGSSIGLLRIDGDIANNTLFCMNLFEEPQKQLVWILTSDLSLDEIQFNIAEAIVYSFAFAVKNKVTCNSSYFTQTDIIH